MHRLAVFESRMDLLEHELELRQAPDGRQPFDVRVPVDELEPVEEPETGFRPVKSYYYWPLGMALGLVGLLCAAALLQRVVLRRRAGGEVHAG